MELGELINKYLNDQDMSIRQFAKKADMSHTYITYIINGKTSRGKKPTVTTDKFKDIANAMGMSASELMNAVDPEITTLKKSWKETYDIIAKEIGLDKPDFVLTDEEWDLIACFRKASEKEKALVHNLLDDYLEE